MNTVLIILLVVLPLLKFVLAPARTMGRGGSSTIFGAILLVGMMMLIFLVMQSLTATSDTSGNKTAATSVTLPGGATPEQDQQDLQRLNENLKKLGL